MNKPKGHEEPIYEDIYQKPVFYPEKVRKDVDTIKLLDKVLKKIDNNNKKLRISRVSNGFVVEYPNDNGGEFPPKEIYEYDTYTRQPISKIVTMLYSLLSWMGIIGNRYDEECIQIRVVHGDKYACKNKKCPICREGI